MWEDNELLNLLQHNGVGITQLASWEEEAYLSKWFNRVVPKDKRQAAMDLNCFCGYRLLGDGVVFSWGFLWHVFSSGLLDSLEGSQAKREFDRIPKDDAVLLDYLKRDAYRVRNTSRILSAHLDRGKDILLTDSNFEWTYAKTHESGDRAIFSLYPYGIGRTNRFAEAEGLSIRQRALSTHKKPFPRSSGERTRWRKRA